MGKVIFRSALGVIIGIMLYSMLSEGGYPLAESPLLTILWSIGFTNSFTFNLRLISQALSWSANLGIISFLSFGSGMIGFVVLIIMVGFVLSFGWLYGWYLLVHDLWIALR